MNRLFLAFIAVLAVGCSGSRGIDSFYKSHKNDPEVMAVRVPEVMLSFLRTASPEMREFIGNAQDIRYMKLPLPGEVEKNEINDWVDNLEDGSFIEIYRRNDPQGKNVVSIRENGRSVKEVVVYTSDMNTGSILYFSGDFAPAKIREMAKTSGFDKFATSLLLEFKPMTPVSE
ncbi:MAG: DUF4252 domain-containing protein [Flavobacteriaceae bacterium]|nr:DUF4252 domain-containing protein [Flavobacteriaceae bacterium]